MSNEHEALAKARIDAADAYWRSKAYHNGEAMFSLPGGFFWHELIDAVLATPSPAPSDTLERREAKWRYVLNTARAPMSTRDDMRTALTLIATAAERELALSLPAREVSGERAVEAAYRHGHSDGSLGASVLDEDDNWQRYRSTLALATTPAPREKLEADLRIGDKVEVIGEYAETFRGVDTWIAGIRVHDTGEGLDYTLAEQWPVPNRNWSNYRGQTDGFRAEELRRITLNRLSGEG